MIDEEPGGDPGRWVTLGVVLTPPPPTGLATPGSLADLCDRDPLDLDADPRLCPGSLVETVAPEPCGALCTPWCLASHGVGALPDR